MIAGTSGGEAGLLKNKIRFEFYGYWQIHASEVKEISMEVAQCIVITYQPNERNFYTKKPQQFNNCLAFYSKLNGLQHFSFSELNVSSDWGFIQSKWLEDTCTLYREDRATRGFMYFDIIDSIALQVVVSRCYWIIKDSTWSCSLCGDVLLYTCTRSI